MTFTREDGLFYKTTQDMPIRELVKHIRTIVRSSAKQGLIPPEWTYSVRRNSGTGYNEIEIKVVVPEELLDLKHDFQGEHGMLLPGCQEFLTGEYEPLRRLYETEQMLREIHAAYNFYEACVYGDGCSMRYFGGITTISNYEYEHFYK